VNDTDIQDIPTIYPLIKAKQQQTGSSMLSDLYIGTLLKILIASKLQNRAGMYWNWERELVFH
jgi:hypothetical protein